MSNAGTAGIDGNADRWAWVGSWSVGSVADEVLLERMIASCLWSRS